MSVLELRRCILVLGLLFAGSLHFISCGSFWCLACSCEPSPKQHSHTKASEGNSRDVVTMTNQLAGCLSIGPVSVLLQSPICAALLALGTVDMMLFASPFPFPARVFGFPRFSKCLRIPILHSGFVTTRIAHITCMAAKPDLRATMSEPGVITEKSACHCSCALRRLRELTTGLNRYPIMGATESSTTQ